MRSRWWTWLGYALGGIAVVLLVSVAGVFGLSERRLNRTVAVTPKPITIPSDSVALARGRHMVTSIGKCVECHGERLQGQVIIDDPALGRIVAPNLTQGVGGLGRSRTDADLARAIRHGLAPDGRPLLLMPSVDYVHLTDDDLGAVIAYLKAQPAADNSQLPVRSSLGPVGRALLVANKLPILSAEEIDHAAPSPTPIPAGATAEYGGYLVRVGCIGCHGATLAGGPVPGGDPSWPPAANLTVEGSTKSWSEADFAALLRTGKRPNGSPVNSAMPWRLTAMMTDDEIRAVWLYTRSIPGRTTGERETASR